MLELITELLAKGLNLDEILQETFQRFKNFNAKEIDAVINELILCQGSDDIDVREISAQLAHKFDRKYLCGKLNFFLICQHSKHVGVIELSARLACKINPKYLSDKIDLLFWYYEADVDGKNNDLLRNLILIAMRKWNSEKLSTKFRFLLNCQKSGDDSVRELSAQLIDTISHEYLAQNLNLFYENMNSQDEDLKNLAVRLLEKVTVEEQSEELDRILNEYFK